MTTKLLSNQRGLTAGSLLGGPPLTVHMTRQRPHMLQGSVLPEGDQSPEREAKSQDGAAIPRPKM